MSEMTPPSSRRSARRASRASAPMSIKRDPLVARGGLARRRRDHRCARSWSARSRSSSIATASSKSAARSRTTASSISSISAGVDYSKFPNHTGPRFSVAYTLYSFQKNARVRLRVWTDENEPVPSVTSVWKTANWHERETFDMLGIKFSGHPNLERILMWEGFNGHPLRKDFPIRGIDTGARIYPEVFPEGGGPKAGSTGKDVEGRQRLQGRMEALRHLACRADRRRRESAAAPAAAEAGAEAGRRSRTCRR